MRRHSGKNPSGFVFVFAIRTAASRRDVPGVRNAQSAAVWGAGGCLFLIPSVPLCFYFGFAAALMRWRDCVFVLRVVSSLCFSSLCSLVFFLFVFLRVVVVGGRRGGVGGAEPLRVTSAILADSENTGAVLTTVTASAPVLSQMLCSPCRPAGTLCVATRRAAPSSFAARQT
ncbi:hypothetical protein DQ04_04461010 [Trypanosoma grayi]|uniref:hypothetical protein n=1 Tax=Trypanosoma grayi TaxID=71804 RepID=UPI0004F41FEE|nr:hypothetical protein DQ04_04461010 [Trypanosoma grayi]KEG09902.1 hypothetical protein DQ04_04461010 [Trypanosoma grayi]